MLAQISMHSLRMMSALLPTRSHSSAFQENDGHGEEEEYDSATSPLLPRSLDFASGAGKRSSRFSKPKDSTLPTIVDTQIIQTKRKVLDNPMCAASDLLPPLRCLIFEDEYQQMRCLQNRKEHL